METPEEKKKLEEESASRFERPSRERKLVERYSAPEPGRASPKPLSIDKGPGAQLKDIPNVAFKLSKRKPDDNMQTLHMILFGKKGKAHNMKKNIGQFSGYVWVENEEKQKAKVREKLDKCVKEKLMDFCDVLNIPINKANVRKEELTVKILDFLESPHATTDVLLAEKEQKSKKRKSSTPKSANREDATVTPAKKQRKTPLTVEKQKHVSKGDEDEEDKVESPDFKDVSEEDSESDTAPKEESDHNSRSDDEEEKEKETEKEEDEQNSQVSTKKSSAKKTVKESSGVKNKDKPSSEKKRTPGKSDKTPKSTKKSSTPSSKKGADTDGTSVSKQKSKASSKKQKVDNENQDTDNSAKKKVSSKKQSEKSLPKISAKDQGKSKSSKKTKPGPTREELHVVVGEILKKVDFNTATLSDILKSLGDHFGIDLLHRKAEVKDIITEVINDMSDESEGEEGDENAEAGDDGDKDGGDNDDDVDKDDGEDED